MCLISQSPSALFKWHLNIGSNSQRQRNHPDRTPRTSGYFGKTVSHIDETTGCTAPQGVAEQSYITLVWITLQIWQPEQEKQNGPTLLFSRNFKFSYNGCLWEKLVNSCHTEPHWAWSISLTASKPVSQEPSPNFLLFSHVLCVFWPKLWDLLGAVSEIFKYVSLLLHSSDDITHPSLLKIPQ